MSGDHALGRFMARWYPRIRYDLAASDSETTTLPDLLAMAGPEDAGRWETLKLGYADPRGSDWLRRAVAGTYASRSEDDVVCCAGAQEGLACVLRALHVPADHAIIVVPSYQPTASILGSLYAVTAVALDPARGWALDIDAIARAVRPSTRLVLVNFPNNPTGKVIDPGQFEALVALCRRHGLWLINDEVYRLIDHAGAPRLPQVADAYGRGVSINALSKAHGLPGLRMGWIAVRDAALLARVESARHLFSGCLAGPSEVLAAIAIGAGAQILGRNRAIAAGNLRRWRGFIGRFPSLLDWHEPDGGVVGYVRYSGADGVEALATALARDAGILVLPASLWHAPAPSGGGDRFRIGFGRAGLAEGLTALGAFLSARAAARSR